jgi:hypothetical protein
LDLAAGGSPHVEERYHLLYERLTRGGGTLDNLMRVFMLALFPPSLLRLDRSVVN